MEMWLLTSLQDTQAKPKSPQTFSLLHHKHLLRPGGSCQASRGLQPVAEVKGFCYKSQFSVSSVKLTAPDSSCSWFLP